jgi:hypothetical protein
MKRLFTYSISLCLLALIVFTGCKKDDSYDPQQKTSVGIYYWFTNYNSIDGRWWVRKSDNSVWTWYNAIYKAFNKESKLVQNLNIPLTTVYHEGVYGNNYYQGAFIKNESNNLENAYLQYNSEGADSTYNSVYLKTTEIDDRGIAIGGKSAYVHYHYSDDLKAMRFIRTPQNYFFFYVLQASDSSIINDHPKFKDSLVTIKTDLNLNILTRNQAAVSDTLEYLYHSIFDVQTGNSNIYVTRTEYDYDYYEYLNILETYDKDLNLLNYVTLTDIAPSSTGWSSNDRAFQKIQVTPNKILVFGDRVQSYDGNQVIMMTTFDHQGNYLSTMDIPTRKPSAELKGVEVCPDGKFLLYYTESDEAYGSTYAGVCKIDENGSQEFSLIFPENDPNNYTPCMAYEGTDGIINIFAVRSSQQSAAQTIVVKMDKEGKIK